PVIVTGQGALLPPLADIAELSKKIAFAVAKLAIEQGFADNITDQQLTDAIEDNFWLPEYRDYKRVSAL
ncbi:MAG: NAD-dependent malic enzyme, partial [Methylophagaceae bacterium]